MKKAAAIAMALALALAMVPGTALADTTYTVTTATELLNAVAAAGHANTIQLANDIDIEDNCLLISLYLTLDLNGHTLSGTGGGAAGAVVNIAAAGWLVIGGTTGGSIAASAGDAVLVAGELTVLSGLSLSAAAEKKALNVGGKVTVEPGAVLTIAARQAYIAEGGALNNNGAVVIATDAAFVNDGTINNSVHSDTAWLDKVTGEGVKNIADSGSSDVSAFADIAYVVTIPASVTFGTINRSMAEAKVDFDVTVAGATIEPGASIKVTNLTKADDMVMRNKDGMGEIELPFELGADSFTFLYDGLTGGSMTIDSFVRCKPSRDLKAAGSYKGQMTFSIVYIPKP